MTRSIVSLFAVLTITACAHPLAFLRAGPTDPWRGALSRAQELSVSGRYAEADRMLADFAARNPGTDGAAESLYWRAVLSLDPANEQGSVEVAVGHLDAYLDSGARLQRVSEAAALRRVAREALILEEARATLAQRQRAGPVETRGGEVEERRDPESQREVQRLREELAKANAELERIRRRLTQRSP